MAREEAARLHHEYVGTEHILLGLIREGEGVAAAVLTALNVDFQEIQQKIEETVKKGKVAAPAGPDLPYTSAAKKVLELAMSEARELDHSYVGTEHLLLGLVREKRGIAAQVLTGAGVNLEQARAETVRFVPESQRTEPRHLGQHPNEILSRMSALGAQLRQQPAPNSPSLRMVAEELETLISELRAPARSARKGWWRFFW